MAEEVKSAEKTGEDTIKAAAEKTVKAKTESKPESAATKKSVKPKAAAAETSAAKKSSKKAENSADNTAKAPVEAAAKKEAKKAPVKLVKVTLIKSISNLRQDQIATCEALGLRKIRQYNILKDNAAIRGMIFKVRHLVTVTEVIQEA
jgi:large subunit ribosomal protein L30